MTLVARFGVKRLLAATTLLAMGCIAAISQADIAPAMVLPLIAGMGGGLITGCVGQAALAVSFYPPELRATGVGWAAALGRVGSIVGPAVGGALLSFAWPAREIVLTALAPALLALVVLAALGLLGRRHAAVSIR
jgi:AAHS family 4-hydroxybenzoate transporter-like MFS transporter